MVYAVKINITRLNRNGIFYTIYRTPQSNINNNAIVDETKIEEVAVIDQDAYDNNNYDKENGRYVFYDIDTNIQDDWALDEDPRLCPNAIEYKSFLTTNTSVPTPNYSYEYKNGLLYFQAEIGSTELSKNYSYFVKAFRLGRYIGDSTKRGFLNINIPSGIAESDIKTEISVNNSGTDVILGTYGFNDLLNQTPVENYTDPFDNVTSQDMFSNNKDIRLELGESDQSVIILPNIFSNDTMINKYKRQYEASTYKITNKNIADNTIYNTTSLNIDAHSISNSIKSIVIDCTSDEHDPNDNITYELILHNENESDVSMYRYNNIFNALIHRDYDVMSNSLTKDFKTNIYYNNTSNENEYITFSLPIYYQELKTISIKFIDYSGNVSHEYKYDASTFSSNNPYFEKVEDAGYTRIDDRISDVIPIEEAAENQEDAATSEEETEEITENVENEEQVPTNEEGLNIEFGAQNESEGE